MSLKKLKAIIGLQKYKKGAPISYDIIIFWDGVKGKLISRRPC